MSHTAESNSTTGGRGLPGMTKLLLVGAAVIGAGTIYILTGEDGESVSAGTTFAAVRGPLEVLVEAGGDVIAQETQEIKSKVEKSTTILFLEEEGTRITKEDVEDQKLLVELDSSQLQDRLDLDELSHQTTTSDLVERQHQVELLRSINESNIRQAQLALRFALMDLQKYLGEGPSNDILSRLGLDKKREEIEALIREGADAPSSAVLDANAIIETGSSGGRIGAMATDAHLLKGDPAAAARGEGGGPRTGGWQSQGGQGGGRAGGWQRGQGGQGGAQRGSGRPGGPRGGNFDPERMRKMMESGDIPEEVLKRMKERGIDPSQFGKGREQAKENEVKQGELEPAKEELATEDTESFTVKLDSEYEALRSSIDFSQYADLATLQDGQGKQDLREMQNEILTTKEDLELARTTLKGTQKLFEKNFANRSELDRDQATFNRLKLRYEKNNTDDALYKKYEFVKQAETFLSEYEERLMDLQRIDTENRIELEQAKQRVQYKRKSWSHEERELEELREQIAACKMYAERPGLIVYGGGGNTGGRYGGQNDQIEEGSSVRERQTIMNIPDMTSMAVKVQIHESAVQKVLVGQKVRMRVQAKNDVLMTGSVEKVSAVADSANRWMSPDLKEYRTTVLIDGEYEWLKPGMSADVSIIVNELEDVLYVPIDAVKYFGDSDRAVYVAGSNGPERRIVTTGSFSDNFIEIVEGLSEGERVYLHIPDSMRNDTNIMSTAI